MDFIYQQFIAGKQKAIAGFIVGFVVTQLAQHGVNLNAILQPGVLDNLIYGGLVLLGVYLKRNKG